MRYAELLLTCVLLATVSGNEAAPVPQELEPPQVEIRDLIRNVLKWGDSNRAIDLLPAMGKDGICIGFDKRKLNEYLNVLRTTGYFANEFITHYKCIVETLDRKVRNHELPEWYINEPTPAAFGLPPDSSPWCLCQDNLDWDTVDIEVISLDKTKGQLKWNWGKLDPSYHPSWSEFRYAFRVVYEDGRWKIASLEGFDFQECP